jgi:hypothetical protein
VRRNEYSTAEKLIREHPAVNLEGYGLDCCLMGARDLDGTDGGRKTLQNILSSEQALLDHKAQSLMIRHGAAYFFPAVFRAAFPEHPLVDLASGLLKQSEDKRTSEALNCIRDRLETTGGLKPPLGWADITLDREAFEKSVQALPETWKFECEAKTTWQQIQNKLFPASREPE